MKLWMFTKVWIVFCALSMTIFLAFVLFMPTPERVEQIPFGDTDIHRVQQ